MMACLGSTYDSLLCTYAYSEFTLTTGFMVRRQLADKLQKDGNSGYFVLHDEQAEWIRGLLLC